MDLNKFNMEAKKIKNIIQGLDVNSIVNNVEIIGDLKGILNEVNEDIKIFSNIKGEVLRVDTILRERMKDRGDSVKEIINKIKSNETN